MSDQQRWSQCNYCGKFYRLEEKQCPLCKTPKNSEQPESLKIGAAEPGPVFSNLGCLIKLLCMAFLYFIQRYR